MHVTISRRLFSRENISMTFKKRLNIVVCLPGQDDLYSAYFRIASRVYECVTLRLFCYLPDLMTSESFQLPKGAETNWVVVIVAAIFLPPKINSARTERHLSTFAAGEKRNKSIRSSYLASHYDTSINGKEWKLHSEMSKTTIRMAACEVWRRPGTMPRP